MENYVRAFACVPNIQVGNVQFNVAETVKMIQENDGDILVFPELGITGYTCADLFFQKTLIRDSYLALDQIKEVSKEKDSVIVVGLPIDINSHLYNCAAVIYKGKLYGISVKTYLPNYSEFYEQRWFDSATSLQVSEYKGVPIGSSLIYDIKGLKLGIEICEDLWAPIPVSSLLCAKGAEIIVNLSASNEIIGKRNYRKQLVVSQTAAQYCGYVYCSAGRCESTQDLIFSGHCLICENGSTLAESKNEISSDFVIASDIDLDRIRGSRLKNTTYDKFCEIFKDYPSKTVEVAGEENEFTSDGSLRDIYKLPFVPANNKDRFQRCDSIFQMQVAGLKKRLEHVNCKPVIGISGGLDSTLALLVAVEAIRQLNRSTKDVIGITMPCFGTSGRTYKNALDLMEKLNITSVEIDIKEAVNLHFRDIGQDPENHDLTYENSQARERTQILMDYAGKSGGLVVGTGDLSELALGWCTYNADQMSMYGVNTSIPKTLIRWMIETISQLEQFTIAKDTLEDILDTPISPELLPPDASGKIAQITEDKVGPYALHDFFLYYMLRFGMSPTKIFHMAERAFKDDFDAATILKWERTFYWRFFSQQFKRSCMPDAVKVGSICLSPRGDWRMPSDATARIWINELEQIEL